jgi:hypothetical protein
MQPISSEMQLTSMDNGKVRTRTNRSGGVQVTAAADKDDGCS